MSVQQCFLGVRLCIFRLYFWSVGKIFVRMSCVLRFLSLLLILFSLFVFFFFSLFRQCLVNFCGLRLVFRLNFVSLVFIQLYFFMWLSVFMVIVVGLQVFWCIRYIFCFVLIWMMFFLNQLLFNMYFNVCIFCSSFLINCCIDILFCIREIFCLFISVLFCLIV